MIGRSRCHNPPRVRESNATANDASAGTRELIQSLLHRVSIVGSIERFAERVHRGEAAHFRCGASDVRRRDLW